MASQSNVAYDFDRFEIQRQPQRKPKLKVVTKKQQQRKNKELIAKVAVCVAIFFVGLQSAAGASGIRLPHAERRAGKLDGAEQHRKYGDP